MPIVITGNPGVGKHAITEQIAERMKLSILDINKIAGDSGLFEKNDNDDTNDIDVEELEKVLESKIPKNSNGVIVVGHLAPYVLRENQVKIMIVLRKSPYDLIPVYKDRKYSDKKIMDNAGSEILGIIANDAMEKFQEKTFQIDASNKTIQEIVEKTMRIITNDDDDDDDDDDDQDESVDWLELVRKNNDLGKFFID